MTFHHASRAWQLHTWSSRKPCTRMVRACIQSASLASGTVGSSIGSDSICLCTAYLQAGTARQPSIRRYMQQLRVKLLLVLPDISLQV